MNVMGVNKGFYWTMTYFRRQKFMYDTINWAKTLWLDRPLALEENLLLFC